MVIRGAAMETGAFGVCTRFTSLVQFSSAVHSIDPSCDDAKMTYTVPKCSAVEFAFSNSKYSKYSLSCPCPLVL